MLPLKPCLLKNVCNIFSMTYRLKKTAMPHKKRRYKHAVWPLPHSNVFYPARDLDFPISGKPYIIVLVQKHQTWKNDITNGFYRQIISIKGAGMRPLWSGAISFGLIYIPVKMYKATEERRLDFHLYRKKDLCPVQYARVCKATGEEIDTSDIVRGYEYEKGDIVILHDRDFSKAYSKRTEIIEIMEFVDSSDIDSKYFERPYYLEPEKGAQKVYLLLVEALKKSGKAGISRFVLRNLEHLGLLKEEKGLLIVNQMRFDSEIRQPDMLNIPEKGKVSSSELDMAIQLIDKLSTAFEPQKFKDTYSRVLKKAIKEHAKKGKVEQKMPAREPAEVIDIMDRLKQSLEQAKEKQDAS